MLTHKSCISTVASFVSSTNDDVAAYCTVAAINLGLYYRSYSSFANHYLLYRPSIVHLGVFVTVQ
jgi:hypothetical protein